MRFEQVVEHKVKAVRERMRNHDASEMYIEVRVTGRVQTGDLKITYCFGEYSGRVEGNELDKVIEEYMRRKGWDEVNAPIAISYQPNSETDYEDDDLGEKVLIPPLMSEAMSNDDEKF